MRIEVDGLGYHVEVSGEGPALVMLHGFTGSTRSWDGHTERIRELAADRTDWPGHTSILVDLPGHGLSDSPTDAERYSMEQAAADLVVILDTLGQPRAALVGYSLGGRLALYFTLAYPDRVAALVLESASPGIEDAEEREQRVESDDELAAFLEREGVEAFVERWEAHPLFATQSTLSDSVRTGLRRQRLANNTQGLANSLRSMGAGAQPSLWNRLGEITVPVLLLAGEHDPKFRGIQQRMWDLLPRVGATTVRGAGHAIHLEQPEQFDTRVVEFLWGSLPGWSSREEIQWQ
ncbi:MAG: 2-succinyl-6-hydroxy-2,4-cyclohexadiene-1-carboxylate synthase [Chloroflexota bacterium]|nr:2-succinyl-6-hydroxy-2,4-cyclohexadiene-1-carboxylate synthase [Chloroflexota bacterium]